MSLLDGINDTEDELYTFDSIIGTEVKYNALESLEKIKKRFYWEYETCSNLDLMEKEIATIEQALKDKEEYLSLYNKYYQAYIKLREEKSKKEQALEIIKEVDLKVKVFIEDWCNNSEDCYADYVHLCNDYHNDGYRRILLKEEFDLLIEVLL